MDPVNFDKIILNILSNAFKFTPEGGSVDIRLRTGKDSTLPKPLQQYAEITVTDSGIGIAPKKQNTYSNAFTRYGIAKTTQT